MINPPTPFLMLAPLGVLLLSSCNPQSSSEPELEERGGVAPAQVTKLKGEVTFTLEDGEELHGQYPDTFWIPSKERRENLKKDDLVKLVFILTDGGQTQRERMWVIVESGDRSGYAGVLDNNPLCTDQITSGHPVSFEPRHVIELFEDVVPESDEGAESESAAGPE